MNMRTSILASFTVAALAALLLTGCERKKDMTGRPVEFSAEIYCSDPFSRSGLPQTRVAYGVESGTSQAINWMDGDMITIYCAKCDGKKSALYGVQDIEVASTDNMDSYAGIENAESDGEGLQWGTGQHTFYAVYPGVITGAGSTISGKDVTGSIPAIQTAGTISGTDNKTVSPDMKNMYMVSKAGTYEPDASPVTLIFQPLTTVLEFTVTNKFDDTGSAMNVSSISLISDHHALDGGFSVDMDQSGLYGRPKTTLAYGLAATGHNKVTLNFSPSVSIAHDRTLTFTFFLNPGNTADQVNDLTFEIKGTNAGTSAPFTRRAMLKDKDDHGVIFETHKKTRVTGIMVPEGVQWTVNYSDPIVAYWKTGIDDEDLQLEP
ncbi:MAG: fimbrillin family protein [Bacteroidaceae bacterium]|nr:fimbrillin family protein [Bacteroidaceae bacterium]